MVLERSPRQPLDTARDGVFTGQMPSWHPSVKALKSYSSLKYFSIWPLQIWQQLIGWQWDLITQNVILADENRLCLVSIHFLREKALPSVLWDCWLGVKKSTWPAKTSDEMLAWLSVSRERCIWYEYGPADATATPLLLASLKSTMV